MRVEITVARTQPLPAGAMEALSQELARRIDEQFPDTTHHVKVRYATANQLSVLGGSKEARDQISDILQQTWESADDWFITD
ncbi:DNA damage-inducible protein I [Pantoea sp. LMR881]|uniref:DNA damage-inducible protein I n=1 Tax=Pantoea sp. LMR881 TaxID=3014336 RepID=UPI0022B0003B|nr:DNA damage-inducible protein I [Pantoea sp. LMR881]MCZ4058719.1 DNA damage-inducible protein I [Pantoea sp. LMR881]